jgi:hypothetical protein
MGHHFERVHVKDCLTMQRTQRKKKSYSVISTALLPTPALTFNSEEHKLERSYKAVIDVP